jgi:hypothetical protein
MNTDVKCWRIFTPVMPVLCEEMTYEIDGRRVPDTFDRD